MNATTSSVLVGFLLFLLHAKSVWGVTCTLVVPDNPLSAQGLATPYRLQAPCSMANPDTAAFVQAVIFDVTNSVFYVYNPLVVSDGSPPAVNPTVPNLPANSIVGLWFGFNSDLLQLSGNSLSSAKCVDGFGQFAYCNAPAFFAAVQQAIDSSRLRAPALNTAKDGRPCPTVRDFSVVDQDQSDNIPAGYLLTSDGKVAQATNKNKQDLGSSATLEANGSDNGLLDSYILPALGCSPWTAQDLADPDARHIPALALNEIIANAWQSNAALVPPSDPMVLVNGQYSATKTNLYRAGVFQPNIQGDLTAAAIRYCVSFRNASRRIYEDRIYTQNFVSPDAGSTSLYTFLASRFVGTYSILKCENLLHQPSPFSVTNNNQGQAAAATFSF